ncbi:MAG: PHP domain-containing protein [Spirochaetales bacterium]|nr:PHP domain-containing protein [Spirochaetales bacterium]
MKIKADLHIHSCLSPCGSLEMSPASIAKTAMERGMHVAALTDHNTALNCKAFDSCCRDVGIFPVFGLEVTSEEEAHILCLFKTVKQAEKMGEIVYDRLPDIFNIPEKFGDQVYVDENDNILGEVDKYLVSATDIPLEELFDIVKTIGGMFIPAHIDKPVFSIPSQLGFLPQMEYTALETVRIPCPVETGDFTLLQDSDAHYIDDIACRFNTFEIEALSFTNIKKAIEGRKKN